MKNTTEIKTIDVQAKEWLDKVNANSYFSAQVTINFGLPGEFTFTLPFQYGYEEHYKDMAFKALQDKGYITKTDGNVVHWRYYEEHNIIANHSIQRGCKKGVVIAWGA